MLRMAYLLDFKGDDTILIGAADTRDVEALIALLRPLVEPDAPPLELHRRLAVGPLHPLRLTAYLAEFDEGVCEGSEQASVPVFDWRRTREGWLDVIGKLETLAAADAGHHYMDNFAGTDDAVVMVARSEYPDTWWRWHA